MFTTPRPTSTSPEGLNVKGFVPANPTGIVCPGDCVENYLRESLVTFTATPAPGWRLSRTSGCQVAPNAVCAALMTEDHAVSFFFTQQVYTLTASVAGNGTITSDPPGISCPGDCAESFVTGTSVSLRAASAPGWAFSGWSGACSGTGACTVGMTTDYVVMAAFVQQVMTLTASLRGNGVVTSDP